MNKSKNELPDYFGFYNAAFAAYAKTLLGANQLMLGYTAAATRTLLHATALAMPAVAAPEVAGDRNGSSTREAPPGASESHVSAAIEAALYADDFPAPSIAASAPEVTLDSANDSLESVPPLSNGLKKMRKRRKK